MKLIRTSITALFTLVAFNSFAAEDFVFHCVDDERTPIWSSFTVVPVLPTNDTDDYTETQRRYQLVYIPKGERLPRLINLTESSVDPESRSFSVSGKIKMPGDKAKRLKSYLREGSDEAFFMDNNPDKVEVAFSLTFKIDNINSAKAEENDDIGRFSYELRLSDEMTIPVASSYGGEATDRNRRFRPYCIRSGVEVDNG